MKRLYLLKSLLIFLFFIALSAPFTYGQSGCPGCVVQLPDSLAEDTIFLTAAATGQVGLYYDDDLSFRLPKTTTPVAAVDPDIPAGLPISAIEIISVSNLPPGLVWEANQNEFDLSEETDGCGKICGTPLQPGIYLVEVVVSAQVVVFSQNTSFSFPLEILPAESVTEGFNLINNTGCGEVTVSFENNVPSGGVDGFAYFWDFGNGETTGAENPVPQTYDQPGTYEVAYEAIVDTAGYFLTKVTIETVECNDLFNNRPDLKIQVFNPAGEEIFLSDIINNADTPLAFNLNIELGEGDYRIDVVDDDNGLDGADDLCGSFNFNRFSAATITDNMAELTIDIIHPVDTIRSLDTVVVFPQPDPPVITPVFTTPLCESDTAVLLTDYANGVQWYQDSLPVFSTDSLGLLASETGMYYARYTSPDGCISTSEAIGLAFGERPEGVAYEVENNLLTVFESDVLPDFFSVQWRLNDEPIVGAEDLTYCIDTSGTYTLVLTDVENGCSSSFTQMLDYDSNFPNCVTAVDDIPAALATDLQVFPNPGTGYYRLSGYFHTPISGRLRIKNSWGQIMQTLPLREHIGSVNLPIDLTVLPNGMYWIELQLAHHFKVFSIIKQ